MAMEAKVLEVGTKGVVGLTQWFERMETVFYISNCAVKNQVKFAICTLLRAALTWWNSHVKTVGHDAAYGMPWKTLMKELALMCGRMFLEESDEVEKYIGGLPDMIQAKNKRKFDNNNQAQHKLPKRQNVAQAYAAGTGERKEYVGTLSLCNKCKFHHKKVSHLTRDCWNPTATSNQRIITCYECTEARGMVYALGGGETNQDLDDMEDDINA
ncbi:hypothetical protein Tco_1067567 [Tanacetum coccineum]|uniref:Reverse transcriptase domain-containing protein n=1 Tax=Tanacetum coccineum TaxID=301880 RepID=A0ABQ5HD92_9ASTR